MAVATTDPLVDVDYAAPNVRLGRHLLSLLWTQQEWVWRRAESISIPDDVTSVHRNTITFRVPPSIRHGGPQPLMNDDEQVLDLADTNVEVSAANSTGCLIPVAVLSKHIGFSEISVTDGADEVIPWLPKRANDWAWWSALCACGCLALDVADIAQLPADLVEYFRRVACQYSHNKCDLVQQAREFRNALTSPQDFDHSFDSCVSNEAFCLLLKVVASTWLLLIPATEDARDALMTVKLSYRASLCWAPATAVAKSDYVRVSLPPYIRHRDEHKTQKGIRDWYQWRKWLLWLQLGWSPATFILPAHSSLSGKSYSVDFEAPEGQVVTGAELRYEEVLGGLGTTPGNFAGRHAHLYTTLNRARRPNIWIRTVPTSGGIGAHAAVGALAVAGLLTTLLALLGKVVVAERSASAALLLAVPTVLLALVARGERHELTSIMRSGMRSLLVVSASSLYIAALLLLLNLDIGTVYWVWLLCALAAWTAAWLIGKSHLTAKRAIRASSGGVN